jgi:uncharacterized protein (TIGR02246 family)
MIAVPIASPTATDETALRTLVATLFQRWNAGDGIGYADLFTEHSDYVAFDGSHARGRLENAHIHEKLFRTWLKGSVLEGRIVQLRFLTPDVALLHLVGNVRLRWQRRPSPARESIQTLVAVKCADIWRFEAFHNTRIAPRNPFSTLMMLLGRK